MSQVKREKIQVHKAKYEALKAERAELRAKVDGLIKTIEAITPRVRARLMTVGPGPDDHPSAAADDDNVVIIEVEVGGRVYQGTLDGRSFNDGRTPEKLCQDFGMVAASRLIGPIMADMVQRTALAPMQELEAIIKANDPQLNLPVEAANQDAQPEHL